VLLWGREGLHAVATAQTPWLWQGYLAPGHVTLVISRWKAGKTTLASVLLAKMKTGGELAGLPVAAGRAVVVCEEPASLWEGRSRQLDFGDHVGWYCKPFKGRPRLAQWLAFLERLARLRAERGVGLVVLDPWAYFFPGRSENDAGSVLDAVLSLQILTAAGQAVLALHHPRKGKSAAGEAARGSGVLPSHADILIEMGYYRRGDPDDRRRKVRAFSRFAETPRQLVIELNPEGTDYLALGSVQDLEFADSWRLLQRTLDTAERKLTRREIRKQWPGGPAPDEGTLYRWLERAVAEGLLCKSGAGVRGDPFRYWLRSREAVWRQDPFAALHMPELFWPDPGAGPVPNDHP
jgi:hypothetical protein